MRPKGFIIDVPVTLSVAVRGKSEAEAKKIARELAYELQPSTEFIAGYCDGAELSPGTITEVSFESNTEDACEVLEELEADD